MEHGEPIVHEGSCHCEGVRFRVTAPAALELHECNCSICVRVGYLHLIVDQERFELLAGRDLLTTYRFNTGTARHTFCSVCGVKPFYVPRSHPEGVSVNARCLDPATVRARVVRPFDGANWEANVNALPPLSQDAE